MIERQFTLGKLLNTLKAIEDRNPMVYKNLLEQFNKRSDEELCQIIQKDIIYQLNQLQEEKDASTNSP